MNQEQLSSQASPRPRLAAAGGSRRHFLAAVATTVAAASFPSAETQAQQDVATGGLAEVSGTEHWTLKRAGAENVKLFLWRKQLKDAAPAGAGGKAPRGT